MTVKKIGETTEKALEQVSQEKIIFFLVQMPYGIQKMSGSIEGLVETSINPGILMLNEEECIALKKYRVKTIPATGGMAKDLPESGQLSLL